MRRHKEQKVNHDSKSSQDPCEGTSARTRPYSFEEIMFNRKNKKLSQNHEIEAGGLEDKLDHKSELLQADKEDRRNKYFSHGDRNSNSEKNMHCTSRTKDRSSSIKVESLIVGKVGVSPVEPKVKSEVVSDTRNKETLDKRNAQNHKKTKEDERPSDSIEGAAVYSHPKNSLLKKRNGDYHEEKSEREGKRKERNSSDMKNNDDFLKAEYKRKIKYSEGEVFSGDVGKNGRENKTVYNRNYLNRKHSDKGITNKHGVLKKASVLSERRERIHSPPPTREQSSKRRRRSSSGERKRDRDQNLSSHEVQKHNPYHQQNHAVSSSHSSKDRSGKYISELDMNSKCGTSSPGHHKGHNASSDKLGGYSPRKKRTEDAIKIPSPTKGISGKKRAGWDLPHTKFDSIMSSALLPLACVQSKPLTMQDLGDVLAVSSSHFEPSFGNLNAQSAVPNLLIDSVQLTQSTRPMRRLVIENVPSTASEKTVMDCLNKFLLPSGANFIQGTQPCISCVIHKEKSQALVEFLTPEDASTALSLNGCSFLGFDLKIRRPKDFVAVETALHEKSVAPVNAVSDVVNDSPHKIFIGGISRALSPKMLMEIACSFGPLKAYKFLLKNDLDEPQAFLQYVDQSITAKACAGLNGMKLGGQTLTVIQATTDKPSSDIESSPLYEIPETAKPLLADPTEVLVLKNVFDPECFASMSQPVIEEILEDVRLECTRFGTVKSINVVTCDRSSIAPSEIIEDGAAKFIATDGIGQDSDSGDLNSKEGSSNQMAEEDYEDNVKSHNLNVEEPPNDTVADNKNFDDKEKPVAFDCTLSNEISSTRSEVANKPSRLIVEMRDTNISEAEGNVGGGELNSDGDNKQCLSYSDEPSCCTGTIVEAAEKNGGIRQLDGLISVLLPGSICVEFRRSEAACMAAHCLNGRAFDNRFVSVEYISLDLYRRKFP